MELGFQSLTEGKCPPELAGVLLKAVLLLLSHSEGCSAGGAAVAGVSSAG